MNQRDIAQLRAELSELREEVARLRSMVEAPPTVDEIEDDEAPPPDREWGRVDLPAAHVDFPGTPKRRALTLDLWREEVGVRSDSAESHAAVGTTGTVLEYRYDAPGDIGLSVTEITSRGGVRITLDEHLDRLRARMLRAGPVSILDEESAKAGRFRTLRFHLALGGGAHARVVLAVGPARKRQPPESPDVIIYIARAQWPEGEHTPLLAQRFLGSFQVD